MWEKRGRPEPYLKSAKHGRERDGDNQEERRLKPSAQSRLHKTNKVIHAT